MKIRIKLFRMRRAGNVARMWERKGLYRPLGNPRRRRECNIKMDLQKWEAREWIGFI